MISDEKLYACFIEWQKAFARVNWIKLMQILKETDIDWRERRLMSKVYLDGGYAVAKLVVALRYKPEGRRLDSR